MPKYKVGCSFGFVGDDSEEIIEADSEQDALDQMWDYACGRISIWAEPISEEEDEEFE